MIRLSVLDQSPIPAGTAAGDALRNTLDLARLCESLGYERYWLAEHHNTSGLAGSAPEVLLAAVGANTTTMRLGSGGVMLSHYSSLKVAESFRMLEALYPGRIDLGIGRAPGSDQLTARALQRDRSRPMADDFGQQLAELVAFLSGGFDGAHPFSRIKVSPAAPTMPELWLLGSSDQSAAYAAYLGLSFAFADFINASDGPGVMNLYRSQYRSDSATGAAGPDGLVALAVLCAPNEHEAKELASSLDLWRKRLGQSGDPGPIPSVEEAIHVPQTAGPSLLVGPQRRLVVGDPAHCRDEIEQVAGLYGVNEVMVVTICHDHQARRRSYELLADVFELQGDDLVGDLGRQAEWVPGRVEQDSPPLPVGLLGR